MCVCVCVRAHARACVHVCACVCVCVCTHMCARVCACVHIRACVHAYVHVGVCACVYMYPSFFKTPLDTLQFLKLNYVASKQAHLFSMYKTTTSDNQPSCHTKSIHVFHLGHVITCNYSKQNL